MCKLTAAKIAVMTDVPYLRKEGRMSAGDGGTYTYAKESDFIDKLHPAMRQHGLAVGVVKYELLHDSMFERANKGISRRVVLLATVRLSHRDGDYEDYQAVGEANDTGDKSCAKAMTQCLKYALRQMFLVETGDDPDDHPSSEQQPAKVQQVSPANKPAPKRGFRIATLINEIALLPHREGETDPPYAGWTPEAILNKATGKRTWNEENFRLACNSDDPRVDATIQALTEMRDFG